MSELEQKILSIIQNHPNIKGRDIALKLEIEKTLINKLLYGKLKNKIFQNSKYEWSIKSEFKPAKTNSFETNKVNKNNLFKLSKYYLDCTVNDADQGIKVFASSKFDLDYAELKKLPLLDEVSLSSEVEDNDEAKKIITKTRIKGNYKTAFIGYPVNVMEITSKKGGNYKFAEPIFLFPVVANSKDGFEVQENLPKLNSSYIKNVTNNISSSSVEETLQIYEELGLNNTDEQIDLDEIFIRLQEIRPDWNWKEKINPYELSSNKKISEIEEIGVYNKCILIFGDRSPYTHGLEKELDKLSNLSEEFFSNTLLGSYIFNKFEKNLNQNQNNINLLEVIPLNSEQREAVKNGLSNPLTVITGPPGTGKSQVVTSLLINAAFQNKKVLFASKNNKAVDVVEARVNGLGPNPILLRHGRSNYQKNLSEYLTNLLSSRVSKDEENNYKELLEKNNILNAERTTYQERLDKIILLRNEVDKLDEKLSKAREEFPKLFVELASEVGEKSYADILIKLKTAKNSLESAKETGGIGFWDWLIIDSRKKEANNAKQLIEEVVNLKKFKTSIPKDSLTLKNINTWKKFIEELYSELEIYNSIFEYLKKVKLLSKSDKPEDISKLVSKLLKKISSNSESLWKSWLKLQPNRLTQDERKILNDYTSILDMISSGDETTDKISSKIRAKYYSLFPKITKMLPCWAITSLSATKIPFQPNFFDILIIDEASQCDIASILPLMYRCKSVVVIGDPKQLKHISGLRKQQDFQLMSKHDILDNFTGWNYSNTSFFDLSKGFCKPEDIVNLKDHHRSHAQIIGFSNKEFYQENLRIATNYKLLKVLDDKKPAVRWIDIVGEASKPVTGGAINLVEIKAIIKFLQDLVINKNYEGTIGLVSPFRAQVNKIRELITNDTELFNKLNNRDFICDTVHKFQGDERDLMVFSPVISKNISKGSLGFLSNNGNLFNVAITRARGALVVIGDFNSCLKSNVSYMKSFANYVKDLKYEETLDEEKLIKDYGPVYPKVTNPEQVSDWEIYFYKILYQNKIKTIPQYNVDQYRLDLALLYKGKKLDIEIDGERYHRAWDGELCLRDQIRNLRLFELGWDVKRFWVYEIRDNLDECIKKIKSWKETC